MLSPLDWNFCKNWNSCAFRLFESWLKGYCSSIFKSCMTLVMRRVNVSREMTLTLVQRCMSWRTWVFQKGQEGRIYIPHILCETLFRAACVHSFYENLTVYVHDTVLISLALQMLPRLRRAPFPKFFFAWFCLTLRVSGIFVSYKKIANINKIKCWHMLCVQHCTVIFHQRSHLISE